MSFLICAIVAIVVAVWLTAGFAMLIFTAVLFTMRLVSLIFGERE